MSRAIAIAGALLLVACAKDTGAAGSAGSGIDDWMDPYMDDPQPPECMDTGGIPCDTSSSGDASHPTCDSTLQCDVAEVCAAQFDGDIGTFVCQSCLGDRDETRWCSDDAACCNAGSTCVRGLCLPGSGGGAGSGSLATSSDSGGSSDSSDSGGSSDSSSGSTG